MLKIINAELFRLGQSFFDEIGDVDWGGDDPPYRGRISPDHFTSEPGKISPHGPQGVINEENYEKYEPSSIESREDEEEDGSFLDEIPEDMFEMEPDPSEPPEGTQEIIYTGQSPYTMQRLVYDGIDNTEVITFEYINRFNEYAGTRRVQPHYTFVAPSTGNEVLVTWDLEKQGIRAFIVGNIHPYGVRYEGFNFDPRGDIMKGVD